MVDTTPAPGKAPQRGAFAWVGAFTGFYPAQSAEFAHLDPVTRFLYASRSVILVISAQAAVIAGLLAATDRHFSVLPFVLVLLGYLVLHAISNLSNDYFGYRRGHDTETRRDGATPCTRSPAAPSPRSCWPPGWPCSRWWRWRSPATSSRCAAGRRCG